MNALEIMLIFQIRKIIEVKDKLEKQIRFIQKKAFVYSDYMDVNIKGEKIKSKCVFKIKL